MVSAEWVRYQYVVECYERLLEHPELATGEAHNDLVYHHHRSLSLDTDDLVDSDYYGLQQSNRRSQVCFLDT